MLVVLGLKNDEFKFKELGKLMLVVVYYQTLVVHNFSYHKARVVVTNLTLIILTLRTFIILFILPTHME
jgi:hypothetical protein